MLFASDGRLVAVKARGKEAKKLRNAAKKVQWAPKDGIYIVYGLKQGHYREMTNEKAGKIATAQSMRRNEPTALAGTHLLNCAEVATFRCISESKNVLTRPFYMKGHGEEGHWIAYGPLTEDAMVAEDRSGAWAKIYDELSLKCTRQKQMIIQIVIKVDRKVMCGRPVVRSWSDDCGNLGYLDEEDMDDAYPTLDDMENLSI